MSTNWTRNPKFAPIYRKKASEQIREIPGLIFFLFWCIFPGLAYWSDPWADFDPQWLKLRAITQESAFYGVRTMADHTRGQILPKNRQNWAWICTAVRRNCVNEDWRQRKVTSLASFVVALPVNFQRSLQPYGKILSNCCQTCQIIVPIHIYPKKLRTYFCARFRP